MILVNKFYWNDKLDNKLRTIYGTMLIVDVAKDLNTTIPSIRYRASKLKLKRNKCKYIFDDNRFWHQDNAAFYWAGFIAADGCIQMHDMKLSIVLSSIDHNHLIKLQEFMLSNTPVRITSRNESYINFYSAHNTIKFLRSLNITPRKSLTLMPPNISNEQSVRAFIRGCIDGDGCISYRRDRNRWTISFSGTQDITSWVSKQFSHFVGVSQNIPSKGIGVFCVGWEGPQTKYIVNWLYQDSTSIDRLDRKYQLAQKLLIDYQDKEPFKSSSQYRGVSFYKRENKWVAAIKVNYKKQVIGHFTTEREAALAYNTKARELGLLERCYNV